MTTHEEQQQRHRNQKRMRQRKAQIQQGTVQYSRREKLILAVTPLLQAGVHPDQIFQALMSAAEFCRMDTYSNMQQIVQQLVDPEERQRVLLQISGEIESTL